MSDAAEMPEVPSFSFEAFEDLLRRIIRAGYRFVRLDETGGEDVRRFVLRHDVDISPACALVLGQRAAGLGVHANFFFQLNAETYSVLNPACLAIMAELRGLGHCVGLHVDEALLGDDEERIAATLDWFDTCVAPIDRAVSFHRPGSGVLGREYGRFVNAYGPAVFSEQTYLSDSRRSGAFRPQLLRWIEEGRSPIQLLLHPEWWYPYPSVEAFWQDLRGRRLHELERYMLANFRKVFSEVITDEDRRFGV